MTPSAAILTMDSCPYVFLISVKYELVMISRPLLLPRIVSAFVVSVFMALNSGTGTSNFASAKAAVDEIKLTINNSAINFFISPPLY